MSLIKKGDKFMISEITTGRAVSEYPQYDLIQLIESVEERLKHNGKTKLNKIHFKLKKYILRVLKN